MLFADLQCWFTVKPEKKKEKKEKKKKEKCENHSFFDVEAIHCFLMTTWPKNFTTKCLQHKRTLIKSS